MCWFFSLCGWSFESFKHSPSQSPGRGHILGNRSHFLCSCKLRSAAPYLHILVGQEFLVSSCSRVVHGRAVVFFGTLWKNLSISALTSYTLVWGSAANQVNTNYDVTLRQSERYDFQIKSSQLYLSNLLYMLDMQHKWNLGLGLGFGFRVRAILVLYYYKSYFIIYAWQNDSILLFYFYFFLIFCTISVSLSLPGGWQWDGHES